MFFAFMLGKNAERRTQMTAWCNVWDRSAAVQKSTI